MFRPRPISLSGCQSKTTLSHDQGPPSAAAAIQLSVSWSSHKQIRNKGHCTMGVHTIKNLACCGACTTTMLNFADEGQLEFLCITLKHPQCKLY